MPKEKTNYTKDDFPKLPRGVWWEESRQRFRVRIYSGQKAFRAPYFSVKSSGSIEQAYQDALDAFHQLSETVKEHASQSSTPLNVNSASALIQSIGRSATSIKINTNSKEPQQKREAKTTWGFATRKPDRRFG